MLSEGLSAPSPGDAGEGGVGVGSITRFIPVDCEGLPTATREASLALALIHSRPDRRATDVQQGAPDRDRAGALWDQNPNSVSAGTRPLTPEGKMLSRVQRDCHMCTVCREQHSVPREIDNGRLPQLPVAAAMRPAAPLLIPQEFPHTFRLPASLHAVRRSASSAHVANKERTPIVRPTQID